MNFKKLIYTVTSILFLNLSYSQDIKVSFSEKMKLTPKKTGYLSSIIGENEKYLFADFKSYKKGVVSVEKISVYNKTDMSLVNSLVIVDKKDKARSNELGEKEKYTVSFVDNKIIVFYLEVEENNIKLFAESYNENLSKASKMKEVLSYKRVIKESAKRRERVELTSRPSVQINNTSILVSYFKKDEDETDINFNYKTYDFDFEEINANSISLPIPENIEEEAIFRVNSFVYDNNGTVYFTETLQTKVGKRKISLFLSENSYKYESFISALQLESGEAVLMDINMENKSIFNLKIIEVKDKVNLVGFFNDNEKDPSGVRTHGFFFRQINPQTLTFSEPILSYFSQSLIEELFRDDQEDKLKTNAKRKDKEEAAEKDKDAIALSYTIERIKTDDEGNMVLFCSKMNNYTTEVCTTDANGRTTCRTVYHCNKRNVTVFKMSSAGEFVWSSNIDRTHTYGGWDIYDLNVVEDDENFYVSYASDFDTDVVEKTKKSKKKSVSYMNKFEYAIFNKETGENEKKMIVINDENTPKSERKYCSAADIQVLNNQFYLTSSKDKVQPWVYATCLCPPAFIGILMTKSGQYQESYIGRFELVK